MLNTIIMALILIVFAAFMGYLAWDSYIARRVEKRSAFHH